MLHPNYTRGRGDGRETFQDILLQPEWCRHAAPTRRPSHSAHHLRPRPLFAPFCSSTCSFFFLSASHSRRLMKDWSLNDAASAEDTAVVHQAEWIGTRRKLVCLAISFPGLHFLTEQAEETADFTIRSGRQAGKKEERRKERTADDSEYGRTGNERGEKET